MGQNYDYLKAIAPESSNLIKGLQAVQTREGYVSDASIVAVADYFHTPVVETEGVLSFYAQFKSTRPGRYQICVCDGTACHIKGSPLISEWISTELGITAGETDADGLFSLETVACLGCCSLAPVFSINGKVFGNLDRKTTIRILKEYRNK
ncbi:MAG: NAD(P)H-dependent oxidoreductase subunit E [Victivallaceae bacterium]|nr:NAD(P)H-dependent oxidoreductase subunit E [Victivallaceae bacterium]